MHQKTNAYGSLQVSGHGVVPGILKYLAAVFVSGDTRSVMPQTKLRGETLS